MTVLTPRSAAWHADRRTGIGSSDAPIITGDAPWGDLLTLYAVKSGIIDEPDFDTPQTEWGRRLEAVVADWFTERYGIAVEPVDERLRHPEHEWMHASLDRRVIGAPALLECKTRRYPTDEWGPEDTAEIPAHYLVQVQHQLAVTGYQTAYVAVLFAGSDPRRYIVPRDEELIADLIMLEAGFMECVRTGTPPAPLVRRQPLVAFRDDEIEANDVLAKGIEGVYHLRREIKALEKDERAASEAVKTLLGSNTAARAGAYRATYKQNADSHPVRWDLVAAAYRKALDEIIAEHVTPDVAAEVARRGLDSIEAQFTDLVPGKRPLLIHRKEEAADAA